jgi:hypothetical protein
MLIVRRATENDIEAIAHIAAAGWRQATELRYRFDLR